MNNSGKPHRSGLNLVHTQVKGCQCPEDLGRDRPSGVKNVAPTSATQPDFLSPTQHDILAISRRLIFNKFVHDTWIRVPSQGIEWIFKNFPTNWTKRSNKSVDFYRASAYWRDILIQQICPSVRPSVCQLRSGIRWKLFNISSQFFHRTVAQSF